MAAQRKFEADHHIAPAQGRPAPKSRSKPGLAGHGHSAQPSPALELQQRLVADLALDTDYVAERWPPVATIAFILATCGGFWGAVALGVAKLAAH